MAVWRGVFLVGVGGGCHAPVHQRESRAPARRDGADTAATSAALPCGAARFHFGTVPLGRYAACRRGSFARRAVSERVARPRGGTGRIRPRQARPSRVAPRDFTSEQFRWVGTRRVGAVPSRAGPLSSFHLPDPRFRVLPPRVYDKKVTLSGKVAHAAVRAAALNEERLREA